MAAIFWMRCGLTERREETVVWGRPERRRLRTWEVRSGDFVEEGEVSSDVDAEFPPIACGETDSTDGFGDVFTELGFIGGEGVEVEGVIDVEVHVDWGVRGLPTWEEVVEFVLDSEEDVACGGLDGEVDDLVEVGGTPGEVAGLSDEG